MSVDESLISVDLANAPDFAVGKTQVRPALREVTCRDSHELLEPRVMQVLVALASQRGQVVSRDRLVELCWNGRVVGDDAISRCITRVRRLGEMDGGFTVETIPRVGYRLTETAPPLPTWPETERRQSVATPPDALVQKRVVVSSRFRKLAIGGVMVMVVAATIAVAAFFILREPTATPEVQTVAILPFKPLVPAERDESLELGMAESLIATLGQRDDQVVRPLSSVRRYMALDQDSIAAGRELKVDVVLDGSIQRDNDRLRVSARLVRVVDGRQLWSQQFDQKFTDIFAVQDAIASRIAQAMPAIKRDVATTQQRRDTQNAEAYALYASGRFAWTRYSEGSLLQAIGFFEQAIARDPNYALAYAGLADCYAILGVFGMRPPHEVFPQARTAVEKALTIDANLAAAHSTLGHIKIQYDHDWDGGARSYARAIELDRNYAPTYHYRGILYAMNGDFARSLADLKRAQQLEPYWIAPHIAEGNLLFGARRYDEALAHLRKTVSLDDRAYNARALLVRTLLASGDYQQAAAELPEQQLQVPSGYALRAQTLVGLGKRDAAVEELNRVLTLAKAKYVQALDIAHIYASLGDADRTIEWIERAMEDRSTQLGFIALEPTFDALRTDPRLTAIVQRIGIYGRKLPE